jgi:hypothetical protein
MDNNFTQYIKNYTIFPHLPETPLSQEEVDSTMKMILIIITVCLPVSFSILSAVLCLLRGRRNTNV